MMIKLASLGTVAAILAATPATANHIFHLNEPFDSRGACEADRAELSNDDGFLLQAFPQLFSSDGDVRSFLNRAFTCEQRSGEWYITDHRSEVLESDWFRRRNR